MTKILAFDPGTNSLGMVLRDTDNGNLKDQVTSGVDIFSDTPSDRKTGRHHSAASERRTFRNMRTRYRSMKRRKQATLKLLIKFGLCPLDIESLNKWRFDNYEKGYDRTFPVHHEAFMNWINFKYTIGSEENIRSVYRLREILATQPLDYSLPESKLILGRAIYSIAVRRGFKSSRIDNSISTENEEDDLELQKSEIELFSGLDKYMKEHNCPTVGAAFARMERVDKVRIRANDDYKPIRYMLKEEIRKIFEVQKLDIDGEYSDLYNGLMSEKKHEGTIFYKNPLKSQKGKVEYCTLEPHRRRCPKSHPANELNVAWQLLNNIKIKKGNEWESLSLDDRNAIFDELFIKERRSRFEFVEIREWLQAKYHTEFEYRVSINYNDKKSIPGCPVIHYLKKILGPEWETKRITGNRKHLKHSERRLKLIDKNDKRSLAEFTEAQGHLTEYSVEDIWHICYESDEKQFVKNFAKDTLGLTPAQVRSIGALWEVIDEGYAKLSLCALRKINPFLAKGYKYSDAVLLANLPGIMGKDFFEQNEKDIIELIEKEKASISDINRIYDITNKLISDYKSLKLENLAFAEHDEDYTLQESDISDVKKACSENYGKEWDILTDDEKDSVITRVGQLYQEFFYKRNRDYYKRINISDSLKSALMKEYPSLTRDKLKKLYHHSDNAYYPPAKINSEGIPQLGSPVKAGLSNPGVLKVLYKIKKNVNELLEKEIIDPDTIVVVETAREKLNDFNMRWAIEEYNSKREKERLEIEKALASLSKELHFTLHDGSVEMARLALYQNKDFVPYKPDNRNNYDKQYEKYKFWIKQKFVDFYTGDYISLSELFSENDLVEVDHILPISKSFDNSISNKVLSSAHYNRVVKGTKLPCELPNYRVDTAEGKRIIDRIHEVEDKVKYLEDKVNYWKGRSSRAADPDSKNEAIKQMHLWSFEYEEWNKRLINLTTTEITPKFRSSQLNDTRTISRYAYHYLKSLFGRVVVQRGETTAVFRKIFGFQSAYEKKDRSRHTHHAIDALTLSLIPYGPKREKMMELYYQKQEAHRFRNYSREQELQAALDSEIHFCGLGDFKPEDIVKYIEETTLVKNDATNNALTPNIKRYRVRGKVVPLRDENGHVVYEKKGNVRRVKAKWVSRGDSIRGEIHQQSFYGKIEKWKDDNIHEKEELFVIRKKIEYKSGDNGKGFKSWDDLKNQMVDKKLFDKFEEKDKDFRKACTDGIYYYALKNGERRKIVVRHVRCIVKKAQPLKKHVFQPRHGGKEQFYYVLSNEAYGLFEYRSDDGKKIYESDNLFTLSTKMKNGELNEIPCPKRIVVKGKEYKHTRTIHTNDTILIYPSNECPEDQYKIDAKMVSERMYRIHTIYEKDKRVGLTRHNLARTSGNRIAINDSNFGNLPDGALTTIANLHFLLLGTDFVIINGKIVPIAHD